MTMKLKEVEYPWNAVHLKKYYYYIYISKKKKKIACLILCNMNYEWLDPFTGYVGNPSL